MEVVTETDLHRGGEGDREVVTEIPASREVVTGSQCFFSCVIVSHVSLAGGCLDSCPRRAVCGKHAVGPSPATNPSSPTSPQSCSTEGKRTARTVLAVFFLSFFLSFFSKCRVLGACVIGDRVADSLGERPAAGMREKQRGVRAQSVLKGIEGSGLGNRSH